MQVTRLFSPVRVLQVFLSIAQIRHSVATFQTRQKEQDHRSLRETEYEDGGSHCQCRASAVFELRVRVDSVHTLDGGACTLEVNEFLQHFL